VSERDGAIALAGELFAAMASFRAKRMFGGQGLFAGEVMFGLIDDGLIYLKTDAALEADLRAAGSQPWLYAERRGSKAGVTIETSYLSLPDVAYDDPDEACAWARRALAVAEAIKAAAPPRRGKRVSAATDPRR
jgi:DNA transformation protein